MSYTAMYRRFRPTTFEEVKGQDAIVTTLKNQIRSDRIGHAYLFCGTRGGFFFHFICNVLTLRLSSTKSENVLG